MNSKDFYLNILKYNFKDLYQSMQNTQHGYNNKLPNPYHLEGNILAHTEMVLTEVVNRYNSDTELMLTALLHDIGKPSCTEDNLDTNHRSFKNHEAISTFMAKPILEVFTSHISFNPETVLKLIALHGSLYNFLTPTGIPKKHWPKIASMFKEDIPLFRKVIKFYECDHYGRIQEVPEDISKVLEDLNNIYTTLLSPKALTLLIGPPRAGKTTWVNKYITTAVVISRDAYVEAIGTGETYSEKWSSLSSKDHQHIDQLIQNDFNKAIKENKHIVIDMTNMSKKSRRKWLANAKNHLKIAKVFIEDTDTLLLRNTPDKSISRKVIESMQRRFVIPTYDEFDIIDFINNQDIQ